MNFHQDCLGYILVIIDLRNMNRKGWIWLPALNNNYHSQHLRMGNTCYVSRRMTWSIPFLQTYVGAEHPTRPSRDPTDTIFWKRRRIKIFLEQVKLVLPLSRPGCWRPWSKDKRLGEWRSQTPCKLLAPEHQIGMIYEQIWYCDDKQNCSQTWITNWSLMSSHGNLFIALNLGLQSCLTKVYQINLCLFWSWEALTSSQTGC